MGKSDQERFSEMKADIDARTHEWFFFCDEHTNGAEKTFVSVVDKLTDLHVIGPFAIQCHMDIHHGPAHDFMGIPLRFVNQSIPKKNNQCLHFAATNPQDSIWLRHAYSIIESGQMEHTPSMLAICVHRAPRRDGDRMVTVAFDAMVVTDVISYYEHPANSRLLQAMQGIEVPEWSAIMFGGESANIAKPIHTIFYELDKMYDDYVTGQIDVIELRRTLGQFFIEDLKNEFN